MLLWALSQPAPKGKEEEGRWIAITEHTEIPTGHSNGDSYWMNICINDVAQIHPAWYRKGKWYNDHSHKAIEDVTHYRMFNNPNAFRSVDEITKEDLGMVHRIVLKYPMYGHITNHIYLLQNLNTSSLPMACTIEVIDYLRSQGYTI